MKDEGSRVLSASPLAGYLADASEIDAAIARVLRSGRYLLGPETEAFEAEFAEYVGGAHCVSAASGTEALHLALRACGIGRGDEVITVSHTAVATVAAIDLCAATPVLIDIEARSFNLDPALLEAACTERTRAVIPVHLYGQAADIAPIQEVCRRRGLRLIEDCSQAHGALYRGARVGTFGDAAAFSFYPTKNLGAIGDGGAVVTNDAAVAASLKSLRQYGWRQTRYVSEEAGWNARMDELQAAILRIKLRRLDEANTRRRALASRYDAGLQGIAGLRLPAERPDGRSVFHQYVVRSARRDELAEYLRSRRIDTLVHYPMPIHRQPAYEGRNLAAGSLVETERVAEEVLSLPIYPEMSDGDIARVIDSVIGGLCS